MVESNTANSDDNKNTQREKEAEKEKYYNINVIQIYKNLIGQVNSIRSNVDATMFSSIKSSVDSLVDVNTPIKDSPQESRFSAFVRLLGLPIFDGKSLYSPGYDIDSTRNADAIIKNTEIASNICKNQVYMEISNWRETSQRTLSNLISKQDAKSSVLALSTIDIRGLDLPFKDVIDRAFDTNTQSADQSFVFSGEHLQVNVSTNYDLIASMAGYDEILKDDNSDYKTRPHIIRPILVDPRIDLSVTPSKNRMAAPFVLGKKKTQLRKGVFLQRPYIEKVIRDRFSTKRSDVLAYNRGKTILSAAGTKENASKYIIQSLSNNPTVSEIEKYQFANFINIIRATLKQLYDSLQVVYPVAACIPNNHTEAKYNWIPLPSSFGLESGCETLPIEKHRSSPCNTAIDGEILSKKVEIEANDLLIERPTEDSIDLGSYAITNDSFLLYDFFSQKSLSNDLMESVSKLEQQRFATTKKANTALSSIEIIMGEISGIGLIDMLAIITALWYTEKEHLIYLIDKEAAKRMLEDKNFNIQIVQDRAKDDDSTAGKEAKAVAIFHRNVARMYSYIAQLYEEISTESNKRTQVKK